MGGRRLIYAALGVLCTGLAVLGVWLPGLPTTPFVLLALWLFARSSDRLSAWLHRIPLLRSALAAADNYQRQRTLPLSVKIISQSFAWGSFLLVLLLTRSFWPTLIVGLAALSCTIFMVRTPTRLRDEVRTPGSSAAANGFSA